MTDIAGNSSIEVNSYTEMNIYIEVNIIIKRLVVLKEILTYLEIHCSSNKVNSFSEVISSIEGDIYNEGNSYVLC